MAATAIGLELGLIDAAGGAALIGAGLLRGSKFVAYEAKATARPSDDSDGPVL